MAGSPIRIAILANARQAIRGLSRAGKAVKVFDRQARSASIGGTKALDEAFERLGAVAGKMSGTLRISGKTLGLSMMTFVAAGVVAGSAQVASALAAGLAAALPAAGVIPGLALVVASALGTVKIAMMGMADATKAGFKAALTGSKADIEAYQESLSTMAPAARRTVGALVSLRPALLAVRSSIQGAFFARVSGQVQGLGQIYLPLFNKHATAVAGSMNRAVRAVGSFAHEGKTVKSVSKIFDTVRDSVDDLTAGIPHLVRGMLPLFSVSTTFLPGLTGGFEAATKRFADFMEQAEKSGKLKELIQGGLDAFKAVGALLSDVGSIIKSVFVDANAGAGNMFTVIGTIVDQVAKFLDSAEGMAAVGAVWDALSHVGTALGDALKVVLPALGKALQAVAPAVGVLVTALSGLIISLSPVLPIIGEVAAVIGTALATALDMAGPAISALLGVVKSLVPLVPVLAEGFLTVVHALLPLIPPIAAIAVALIKGLMPVIRKLMPFVAKLAAAFGDALLKVLRALAPIVPVIVGAFAALLPPVMKLLDAFLPLVPLVATLAATFIGAAVPAIASMVGPVTALAEFLVPVATAIADVAVTIGTALLPLVTTLTPIILGWVAALRVLAAVQLAVNIAMSANPIGLVVIAIAALVAAIVWVATKTRFFQDTWKTVWTAVRSVYSGASTWLKSSVTSLVTAFRNGWARITGVVTTVRTFASNVKSAFIGMVNWINGVPAKIITGLLNGLKAGWSKVTDWFSQAISLIPDTVQNILGIQSPSKIMAGLGANITQGLARGIVGQVPAIDKAMAAVSSAVSGGVATDAAINVTAAGTVTPGSHAGPVPPVVINVSVAAGGDPSEVGRRTVQAIEAWQARTGRKRLLPA